MMYRILVLLLIPTNIAFAMQVNPKGVQPKKPWWKCACECMKTQAKRDAQEREAEQKRLSEERARLDQSIKEDRRRRLLTANSGGLRDAFQSTAEGRHRRATGKTSDPEHIKNFKKAQQMHKAEDAAQQVAAASLRAVTPLGGLGVITLSIEQSTARQSGALTPQPPLSPTPVQHVRTEVV
ncbi:MAG: hypothetical protein ACHQVS_04265 [Candidatus Babeliales bacterium]